ncbi:MAG: rRNA maturation RNase YbeY [Anaerolineales bacterium]|nr:rRNA maturation RNase YbeY [Anaerolineales bacterium]
MININVKRKLKPLIDSDLLKESARTTLEHQRVSLDASLTLVISDDDHLRNLNKQFNEINEPTDVLSFPADHTDPDSNSPYLGDVIISYPRANEQATRIGHPVELELQLLIVHGILHLLGYDHSNQEEKARMWAAQSEILYQLEVFI